MVIETIVIIITFILFLIYGIRIVRPTEVGLIETFGKYSKTGTQGFNWIIPIVQRMLKVNMTENMVDISSQKIITKDDLNAEVDAVVYYRVMNAKNAVYNVDDYEIQIVSLAKTTLRNIIGKMSLSEANSMRGRINIDLEKELSRQIKDWGMTIVRVEMQRIDPPEDVQEAMNLVVVAERKKFASKDLANATEIEADGFRRAEIKKADGIKQSKVLIAQGEARAIELVNVAADKYFKGNAKTLKALEVTENSLKDGTKFVIDSKSNLVNVMTDQAGVTPIPITKKK